MKRLFSTKKNKIPPFSYYRSKYKLVNNKNKSKILKNQKKRVTKIKNLILHQYQQYYKDEKSLKSKRNTIQLLIMLGLGVNLNSNINQTSDFLFESIVFEKLTTNPVTGEFFSKPCGRCLTCGNRKSDGVDCRSMVNYANEIELNTGKKVKLKFNLDCKEAGIYGAQCTTCNEWYVGQTATSFSTCFNGHRRVWKRGVIEDYQNEEKHQSLFDHYKQHHSEFFSLYENEPCKGFDKAYDVYFLDSYLGSRGLTEKKDKWKIKLKFDPVTNINASTKDQAETRALPVSDQLSSKQIIKDKSDKVATVKNVNQKEDTQTNESLESFNIQQTYKDSSGIIKPIHYHKELKIRGKDDEALIINKKIDGIAHNFKFAKEDFAITNDTTSIIREGGFGKVYLLKKFPTISVNFRHAKKYSQANHEDRLDKGRNYPKEHKFVVKSTNYAAKNSGSHNCLEVVIMQKLSIRNPKLSVYLDHVYIDTNKTYSSGIYNGQLLTLMDYMQYDLQEVLLFFDTKIDKEKDSKNRFRKDFDGPYFRLPDWKDFQELSKSVDRLFSTLFRL